MIAAAVGGGGSGRGVRVDRTGLDLATGRAGIQDCRSGHAVLARRRRALGLPLGRAAARRRG